MFIFLLFVATVGKGLVFFVFVLHNNLELKLHHHVFKPMASMREEEEGEDKREINLLHNERRKG